jgi:hypothetical protein
MPKIESMYAFVVEDIAPDDEGLIAQAVGSMWMPLVGADMKRIDSLRPVAAAIGKRIGKKIKLVKFTNRQEVEVI